MSIKKIPGGTITTPKGFKASGLYCGIKAKSRKPDLALVVSDVPAVSAGMFTRNRLKAWPVLHSMQMIRKSEKHRAIIANSGNANCINGPRGKVAVQSVVKSLSENAGIPEKQILICSTGIIGLRLPVLKITRAMPRLVKRLSARGGHRAAQGILTTDTRTKEIGIAFSVGRTEVRMGAIAKGVGMVHPNMATMLNFITTDCAIARPLLFRALRAAVSKTFNMMSIDNDLSTNDTVFILANGRAGNSRLTSPDDKYWRFEEALVYAATQMAKQLIKDGEGATKFCEIVVSGAKNQGDAERAARNIANSMLFKTMLVGADPNWGRIAAAVGASGIAFKPEQLSIAFNGIRLLSHGKYLVSARPDVKKVLKHNEFRIDVVIGEGHHSATFFTCDLTKGYVHINAAYST
ncbi:MAG: bifunctional glutamate N-acetyltransferase/amino-acid acetyltransferase ArgJ [Candidatus Omnitrophica bacterium]|nr:bifunctional glutamate N-acetyltransferase/amino-acid acetyltransferase ArgJ [Candidatus Omnitrophota bacterium]